MNRSLAPLTRKRRLGGTEVSFPLTLAWTTSASVFVPVPRRAVAAMVGTPRLRPVPILPGSGGLLLRHTRWADTPVGPFSEVAVFALVYHGHGSPVPGLAPLLHGLLDRTQVVGDFGFVPVLSFVDEADAAAFRTDLWHVPAHLAPIREGRTGRGTVVQVDHHGDPLVRLAVTATSVTGTTDSHAVLPVFGHDAGVVWCDVGDETFDRVSRRVGVRAGHVGIYRLGPLATLAERIGATAAEGFERRGLVTDVTASGRVRWKGPRPIDPDEAAAVDLVG